MATLPGIMAAGRWPLALLVALALAALAMLLAVPPVGAQTVDYDTDDDGLIEITTPQQLNAVRHDLNGNGDATHNDYVTAFPNRQTGAADRMGCPAGTCTGYELRADLDLSTAYPVWTALGNYSATFDGNGYAISGMTINATANAGLFAQLSGSGVIRNVGIVAPSVTGTTSSIRIGGLVGQVDQNAAIETSYVLGGSVIIGASYIRAGGLVGTLSGAVRASYSTAAVSMTDPCSPCNSHRSGGLVGFSNGGDITASYATGRNTASGLTIRAGGLIGSIETTVGNPAATTDSLCNSQTTGQPNCIGEQTGVSHTAPGYTTRELRRPTAYAGTIYANWNIDLSNPADGVGDDPWDFGTRRHYPLLKIDKNGDGRATCLEFSGQPCYQEPGPPPYNPAHDHPEIYQNARYEMAASCEVQTTGTGDEAVSTSTITFDLGDYTRPLTLALSLWDGEVFRSLQSQNISMPELRQDGQRATVEVVTDPAQTRFRLDSEYGLNLVLGYADCHTDDP